MLFYSSPALDRAMIDMGRMHIKINGIIRHTEIIAYEAAGGKSPGDVISKPINTPATAPETIGIMIERSVCRAGK